MCELGTESVEPCLRATSLVSPGAYFSKNCLNRCPMLASPGGSRVSTAWTAAIAEADGDIADTCRAWLSQWHQRSALSCSDLGSP